MEYHKIRGVDMEVCTAEQKIAYNMAFSAHISFQDRYNSAKKVSAICKADVLDQIVRHEMDCYGYTDKGRYDVDAIFAALRGGIETYMDKPFIATSYAEIGKTFPANYLKNCTKEAAI